MNYFEKPSFSLKNFALSSAILSSALLAGCGSSGGNESAGDNSTAASSPTTGAQIKIKGSDTMSSLSARFKEEFNNIKPDVDISVAGGGSGTGIKAMIEGNADICNSSRPIKETEIAMAEEKGVNPVEHVVGKDGIAVIVHSSNPVNELTLAEIEGIFTGSIDNWSALGGPDEKITVVTRDGASGTYVLFQELAMNSEDYTLGALQQKSNASIVKSVVATETGIGYSGIGFLEGQDVKTIAIAVDENSDPIMPTDETIGSGKYPIARPLLMYTNGVETGEVKEFFDFIYSEAGQAVVSEVGFTALTEELISKYRQD